jgi:hypothetical protein
LAREIVDEHRAADAAEDERFGDRRGGRFGPAAGPKPYPPPATPQGAINTTDLDSRLVKGQHGWLQGYNAQAAADEQRLSSPPRFRSSHATSGIWADRTRRLPQTPRGGRQRAAAGGRG